MLAYVGVLYDDSQALKSPAEVSHCSGTVRAPGQASVLGDLALS